MFCSKDWDDVKLSKLFCNLTYRGVVLQGGRERGEEEEMEKWRVLGKKGGRR